MPATTSKTEAALAGNNLIVVLVLVSLISVAAAFLVDKFLVTTIIRDTKVVSAKAEADKTLSDDVDNAPRLVQDYNNLGNLAHTIADALPNTADFPSLMVTMENMATQSGITLKSIVPPQATAGGVSAPAAPTSSDVSAASSTAGSTSGSTATAGTTASANNSSTTPAPQKYDFTMTFDTNYSALTAFLKDLELSARPMKVTNMQLSGNGGALSATMSVETYYQDKAQLPFGTRTIQ